MVKYLLLSVGILNPCSKTQLAATTANTPSDITGTIRIGLDPSRADASPRQKFGRPSITPEA
jgi:hypothetical protein